MSSSPVAVASVAVAAAAVAVVAAFFFLLRLYLRGPTKGSDNPRRMDERVGNTAMFTCFWQFILFYFTMTLVCLIAQQPIPHFTYQFIYQFVKKI